MPHITIDCENLDDTVETDTGGVEFVGLVKAVVEGYDAFSAELQRLNRRTVSLERRLKSAHDEVSLFVEMSELSCPCPALCIRCVMIMDSSRSRAAVYFVAVIEKLPLCLTRVLNGWRLDS